MDGSSAENAILTDADGHKLARSGTPITFQCDGSVRPSSGLFPRPHSQRDADCPVFSTARSPSPPTHFAYLRLGCPQGDVHSR
eukprot:6617455-Prymnesium_polylepis.1